MSSGAFTESDAGAQGEGAAAVPVESAVGVMLYQMGIGSAVFFGFLAAIAIVAGRCLLQTGRPDFLFAFVAVVTISANAVLQEEAFFSPLALGRFSLARFVTDLGLWSWFLHCFLAALA